MLGRLRTALSHQLSHPSGRFGTWVAGAMNRGNLAMNRTAIDLLDVGPDLRVLDLGFGGGLTLPLLLDRAASVVAVDRADDMVAAATERHAAEVADGRLRVVAGDVAALPLNDGAVDRVLTVNTVYFWRDLAAALGEVRRVLAPGGRVVIGIRDASVMQQIDPAVFTLRRPSEIAEALGAAGFTDAAVETPPDGKTHFISAVRG